MNIRIDSRNGGNLPLLTTTWFLVRRLLVAIVTVFCVWFRWLQIFVCIVLTMLTLSFLLTVKPYETRLMNAIEVINESYVLITCYTLLLYADLLVKE